MRVKIKTLSGCNYTGFTLVELLVALMVTSIILASVATLAFAMGSANDSADDTSQKQAQLRAATIRISELIRHSRLICGIAFSDDIAIWRADDDGDDEIDIDELVYIERTSEHNKLVVWEFSPIFSGWPETRLVNGNLQLKFILYGWRDADKYWLFYASNEEESQLVPECSNVEFRYDQPTEPMTKRQFVNIVFDLSENGVWRQYQINAALRGWAGYLLDGDGDFR